MVLESLFPASKIENKPKEMLLVSFIVTITCVFLSYMVFPAYAGIIAPLLITAALSPLVYRIFSIEEEIEAEEAESKIKLNFYERHSETIWLFSLFFIGNLLAVFLLALILPDAMVQDLFSQQFDEIHAVRGVAGDIIANSAATGHTISGAFLGTITSNNLKVMFFSFILSFFIGTGALFILSWNASILAIYLASFVRQGLYSDFFNQAMGIMPHAPVEILAYFLAGIAGGMLSVGLIREKVRSKEFLLIFRDSLMLMILAVAAVIIGAYLEVGF